MAAAFAIISDLDHTMVQNEDGAHKRLLAFNHVWTAHFADDSNNVLVFSTGRSPELFAQLWEEAPLLTPDVLSCSVGTELLYNTRTPVGKALLANASTSTGANASSAQQAEDQQPGAWACFAADMHWRRELDREGWEREQLLQIVATTCAGRLTPQAASEQGPHKLSYVFVEQHPEEQQHQSRADVVQSRQQVADRLRQTLAERYGPSAVKVIFSGGKDLDVLPGAAGKGQALKFLMQRLRDLNHPVRLVQVNGDSGNDSEMFDVPGVVGCVVSNAHPELAQHAQQMIAQGSSNIFMATQPCAGGILQTMVHFGALSPHSPALLAHAQLLGLSGTPSTATGAAPGAPPPASAQQSPATSTVPPWAGNAPPPGSTVEEASDATNKEGDAVVLAARQVAKLREGQCLPCVPDAETLEVCTGEAANGGAKQALNQEQQRRLRAVVREWAWEFARALVHELSRSWEPSSDGALPAQAAALRLFVSNACEVLPEPDAGGDAQAQGSAPGGAAATEQLDDLRVEGVADAAGHDAGSIEARTWIDQASVQLLPSRAAGDDDAGTASVVERFRVCFKVCTLTLEGRRNVAACRRCVAEGPAWQPSPVPHALLADRVTVSAPLPPSALGPRFVV